MDRSYAAAFFKECQNLEIAAPWQPLETTDALWSCNLFLESNGTYRLPLITMPVLCHVFYNLHPDDNNCDMH